MGKMKNTHKLKKVKFSRKTKKGGIKGYNPIKGIRNIFRGNNREPDIGNYVGVTGVQLQQNIQPLKDVELTMDNIMENILDLKMSCLDECIKKANNIDYETGKQMKDMTKEKDIYEWGNMCSKSLNTPKCSELLSNIKDMELYIKTIKELNEKVDLYSSKLEEVKENIDLSSIDINDSF